ncbi:MAG: type II secretion system protein [bacterium]
MKILNKKGFTLIELLVVISVIGLLSTFAIIGLDNARKKARDGKVRADFKNISTALSMFYDKYGRMPANNWCNGVLAPGAGCHGACQNAGYDMSMQELVTAGFLGAIPKAPIGGYCYYNYGAGNDVGALLATTLETEPASTAGIYPSCRPFAAGTNWCSQSSNTYYCICNPY